jgi:hypothetical protein
MAVIRPAQVHFKIRGEIVLIGTASFAVTNGKALQKCCVTGHELTRADYGSPRDSGFSPAYFSPA